MPLVSSRGTALRITKCSCFICGQNRAVGPEPVIRQSRHRLVRLPVHLVVTMALGHQRPCLSIRTSVVVSLIVYPSACLSLSVRSSIHSPVCRCPSSRLSIRLSVAVRPLVPSEVLWAPAHSLGPAIVTPFCVRALTSIYLSVDRSGRVRRARGAGLCGESPWQGNRLGHVAAGHPAAHTNVRTLFSVIK
jgi:hypothetical protein